MFETCTIRGRRFTPARFCAPLAGYTHSAFRRLLAELGGCGAIWTEMLAARQILSENFRASPWVRRRPEETSLVYQLMIRAGDPVERITERLAEAGADALDLNLACNAWTIRARAAGSALFEDFAALRDVVRAVRTYWPHLLTAKIRLGHQRPDWQGRFADRLRLLEDAGVDAVILHPRFFEEKFKRRARHELFPWACSLTKLPIIANGDLSGKRTLEASPADFVGVCAIMVGRMAVVRPWLFAAWDRDPVIDLAATWRKLYQYVTEDFPPPVALRRIQMFTKYFAANFLFGHRFNANLAQATSLDDLRTRAEAFFSGTPAVVPFPTVAGL